MTQASPTQDRVATLEWISQAMRTRMNNAGVRISLADWQTLNLAQRRVMADAAAQQSLSDAGFVLLLRSALGCNPGALGLD